MPSTEPAVVILSGLSGGGKTAAAKLFEDLGYTVVDNLPGELLPDLAELVSSDRERFARDRDRGRRPRRRRRRCALAAMRGALEGRGIRPQVVVPRGERRGPHPALLRDPPSPPAWRAAGSRAAIAQERRLLDPIRSRLGRRRSTRRTCRCAQLRERLFAQLARTSGPDQMAIQLISFGYKFGVPLEADLLFDVAVHDEPVLRRRPAAAVRA